MINNWSKRYEKILKQSDKQQLDIYKLKLKIESLYNYNINQQLIAKRKLEKILVNEAKEKAKIVFKPSDILSGDFYSIFKVKDGYLIYLIDGQGHGVSPALTIFGVSSTIKTLIKDFSSFNSFIHNLFSNIRQFLDNEEQISYTFLYIKENEIEYSSGGMYPFYIKSREVIQKIKANNLPFLNSSILPTISKIDFSLKELLLYTDGLIEEEILYKEFKPIDIIKSPDILKTIEEESILLNDDLTIIYFNS